MATIRQSLELTEFMTFKKEGRPVAPLATFEVNGQFILGVYKGTLSEFDILVKYRQKS